MGGPDPKFAKFMYYKATHLSSHIQADCKVQRNNSPKQISQKNTDTYKKKESDQKIEKVTTKHTKRIYDIANKKCNAR